MLRTDRIADRNVDYAGNTARFLFADRQSTVAHDQRAHVDEVAFVHRDLPQKTK